MRLLSQVHQVIKRISKRLPNFVRTPSIVQLYGKYNSKILWDEELIEDITQFFDLSNAEAIRSLKSGRRDFIMLWNKINPRNERQILHFYENAPYDVFSLACWHMSRRQRKFRKKVITLCSGKVLDYGGGIGDLCVKLAEKGLETTYGDVKGKNMEFAQWLFKKENLNIKVVDLIREQILEQYDTIIYIDTIEHIPHPETALTTIAKHLKKSGKLIITNLNCPGPTNESPMHFKINFNAEKLLNSHGIVKTKYDWLWIKDRNQAKPTTKEET